MDKTDIDIKLVVPDVTKVLYFSSSPSSQQGLVLRSVSATLVTFMSIDSNSRLEELRFHCICSQMFVLSFPLLTGLLILLNSH